MTPSEALQQAIGARVGMLRMCPQNPGLEEQLAALREALAIVDSVQSTRDTFHTSHGAAWSAGYRQGYGDGLHDGKGWARRRISINPWNGERQGGLVALEALRASGVPFEGSVFPVHTLFHGSGLETGRTRSDVPNQSGVPRVDGSREGRRIAEREDREGTRIAQRDALPGAEVGRVSNGWRSLRPNVQSLPRPENDLINTVGYRRALRDGLQAVPTDAELLARAAERGTPELGAAVYKVFMTSLACDNVWEQEHPTTRQAWRRAAQVAFEAGR